MFQGIRQFHIKKLSSFQVIILSFFCLIMLGTLLLMLPVATQDGTATPLSDALFTAVSATCVTGLVIKDTATYWSLFGRSVILVLIQIGGMGVITVGLLILRMSGKKIGLWQRSTMQESISAPQVGGIVKLTGFILKATVTIELIGAILLAPVFCRDFGVADGLLYAVFHSVSAFCNAGFDLFGVRGEFSSLTSYSADIYVNVIIMMLIVAGDIGFFVWSDLWTHKHHFKQYALQTKIVLVSSAVLIVLPALYFFFLEYTDSSLSERILRSLFQSVTTRTAGFNTADLTQTSESGRALMIILMLIGGSPGSTAGGMKTVTFAVLFFSAVTVLFRRNDVQCFKRRISDKTVRIAGAIFFVYFFLFFAFGCIISVREGLPLLTCLFETSSAIGTVGLSLGITGVIGSFSRILLMILMFFGRVGALTLIYAALPADGTARSRLPLEEINVG